MATAPGKVKFRDRLKQIWTVFTFTAKHDKLFVPLAVVGTVIPLGIGLTLALIGLGWSWLGIGILAAVLAVMIVLNLRSNKAMMAEMAGQPGAAAALVDNMRGD